MRQIEFITRIKPLMKVPVFRALDARKLGVHPSLLSYYVKKGLITRLGHGVYKSAEHQLDIDSRWHQLVLAVKSVPNGVACLNSALALYKLDKFNADTIWIAIPNGTSKPKRDNVNFKRMRDMKTGQHSFTIGSETIPVFDRERSILDTFRNNTKEVALKTLKLALSRNQLNIRRLELYSKKMRIDISQYLLALLI